MRRLDLLTSKSVCCRRASRGLLITVDPLTKELAEDFAGVNWKQLYLEMAVRFRMSAFSHHEAAEHELLFHDGLANSVAFVVSPILSLLMNLEFDTKRRIKAHWTRFWLSMMRPVRTFAASTSTAPSSNLRAWTPFSSLSAVPLSSI